jgi:acyl-CoA thioesterase
MKPEMYDFFRSDPYAKKLNMKLLELKEGYAKTSIKVTEDMLNFHGSAHGGLIFSLADYAFAVASNSHGSIAVGLNIHMSYLAPANVNDELICVAEEKKRTTKIAVYELSIKNNTGELIATMEGMVYRKKQQFIEV